MHAIPGYSLLRRAAFPGATLLGVLVPWWLNSNILDEYCRGDNGAGIGASHQTGWTGLVALLIQVFWRLTPEMLLAEGRQAIFREVKRVDAAAPK